VEDSNGITKFSKLTEFLRVTPAMEAGVADHVWSLEEMIALLR
jgi:hypothetical protein